MLLIMRRIFAQCIACSLIFAASLTVAQTPLLHVTDIEGNPVEKLAVPGTKAVVLIFAATDCPISNRYIPEITRLNQELSAKGVAFRWVFPNPGDTLPIVRKHLVDFGIATPALMDPQQDLVRMAHASVTPEAAVFAAKDGSLREVYHGRIDDRYIAFGQQRPQATRHDLEEAIQAALAGRPTPTPIHSPVGCSIIPPTHKP
jgi:thiol-disulfide isomerase/thioredoxin